MCWFILYSKVIQVYIYTLFFVIFFSIMVYHKILNTVPCAIQQDFVHFLNLFIFKWRITALQCCVGFCCTTTWITHKYTYVPTSWASLPPTQPPSHSSRLSESTGWDSCVLEQLPTSYLLHMVMYIVCQGYSLNWSCPLFPSLYPLYLTSLFLPYPFYT